jgi:hypothetical protein
MTDLDSYMAALRRTDRRAERQARKFRRRMAAEALELVRAAQKAGLTVNGVTVLGVTLGLAEPKAPVRNELDRWLDQHPEIGTDDARSP